MVVELGLRSSSTLLSNYFLLHGSARRRERLLYRYSTADTVP